MKTTNNLCGPCQRVSNQIRDVHVIGCSVPIPPDEDAAHEARIVAYAARHQENLRSGGQTTLFD